MEPIGTSEYPEYNFNTLIDLKARAGYAAGNILVYGLVGAASATWTDNGNEDNGDGFLYGLGIDYLGSSNVFVGAEYVVRAITVDASPFDADVETISLRAGIKF
jgi:outer membrane immunogenic protein